MALFQPTNIFPSALGELGNGTVDIAEPLAVSWQVNGNSAMTAFSITIYQNDTDSTEVYTTGKLTDGCPFYGTNYAGETVFFTHTIPAEALSEAGMENGAQYKLIIQQWWGETDEESVTARSAAVFLTRSAPEVAIQAIPSPLTVRQYTFGADYSQAQGDALNWVRWMLAAQGQESDPLYDSGRIYGTAELKMTYDGLFPGTAYAVRCQIQTENGVTAETPWYNFTVSYATTAVTGAITTCASCQKSGVKVSWPGLYSVAGKTEGDAGISNGKLVIGPGGSVVWDTVTGQPMNYPQPWSLVWQGKVDADRDNDVLTLSFGSAAAVFTLGRSGARLTMGATVLWRQTLNWITGDDTFTLVLADGKIYLRQVTVTGGLYPAEALLPEETLYPLHGTDEVRRFEGTANFGSRSITGMTLGGSQWCDYLWVTGEVLDAAILNRLLSAEGWKPEGFDENTLFLTDFGDKGLQAGNLNFGGTLTGFAIYRYHTGEAALELVAQTALSHRAVWDCKAVSQATYQYYMFGLGQNDAGEDVIVSDAMISDPITPIFWDWTVLRCGQGSDGAYHPTGIYRFGKNLASGAISNNNSPNILENFTRYPTVQPSPANYLSGTLSSLIGRIDREWRYVDTNEERDAIYALSTATEAMFLKDRRGDIWRIRTGGAITMTTMDGSREQAQTAALPWVEIGDVTGSRIVLTAGDSLFS